MTWKNLSKSKIGEFHLISVFSSWRPRISCFCEAQSCFEMLAHSELVLEEENKVCSLPFFCSPLVCPVSVNCGLCMSCICVPIHTFL